MTLLEAMRSFFNREGRHNIYWIAYSGGLDSQVLLELAVTLKAELGLDVRAVHINHHVNPAADEWAKQCAAYCAIKAIPFREFCLAPLPAQNFEEAARKARYAIFAELIQVNHVLLTAHHQDDQAETLLLQLMRGAGLKGLAGMPPVKTFAQGLHARPLLSFSRKALLDFAQEKGLTWIYDESNDNQHYRRNYIRHTILPLLSVHWPMAVQTISRTAAHCAEAQVLLEESALVDVNSLSGLKPNSLSVTKLREFSFERQRLILRTWLQQLGFKLPPQKKIETLQNCILAAAWDAKPFLTWEGVEVRRHRDDLFAIPKLSSHDAATAWGWDLSEVLTLPAIGKLVARTIVGEGLSQTLVSQVKVCFRQGGERVKFGNKRKTRTLKNLFQEWGVQPWERDRLPLLYFQDQIIAIPGYYLHEDYRANSAQTGWVIQIEPSGQPAPT